MRKKQWEQIPKKPAHLLSEAEVAQAAQSAALFETPKEKAKAQPPANNLQGTIDKTGVAGAGQPAKSSNSQSQLVPGNPTDANARA